MPDLIPQVSVDNFPITLAGLSPVSSVPFGLVHRIDFATRQIDVDQRFKNGMHLKYPRWQAVANTTITFYEDVNYSVTRYIRSWMNLVIDDNHNYNVKAGYAFPINLFAFDYVHNSTPSMIGTLLSCWPVGIGALSYAYDQSGPVVITVDFAVDDENLTLSGGVASISALSGLSPIPLAA